MDYIIGCIGLLIGIILTLLLNEDKFYILKPYEEAVLYLLENNTSMSRDALYDTLNMAVSMGPYNLNKTLKDLKQEGLINEVIDIDGHIYYCITGQGVSNPRSKETGL
jgi:hypothetical protein